MIYMSQIIEGGSLCLFGHFKKGGNIMALLEKIIELILCIIFFSFLWKTLTDNWIYPYIIIKEKVRKCLQLLMEDDNKQTPKQD